MPTPKSVTKVIVNSVKGTDHRQGMQVTYTSDVNKCEYYLFELCRAALRDTGKYISKCFKQVFYDTFKRKTGNVGRNTKYKVYSSKNTQYPRVDVSTVDDGFYGLFQEIGTKHLPKYGILRKAVEDNVDTIRQIQSQYLSAIDDGDDAVESLINEDENEGGAED